MKCSCCGKELGDFTTDIGYQLPDVVWKIPEEERDKKAKFNTDLCKHEGKYYLRGIMYIPIVGSEMLFGWGLWVEVDEESFNKYLSVYEIDGSKEPPITGILANTPPGYEDTSSLFVKVHFGSSTERPWLVLESSPHKLSQEQQNGISVERVHELNKSLR